jgi:polygalacturonase
VVITHQYDDAKAQGMTSTRSGTWLILFLVGCTSASHSEPMASVGGSSGTQGGGAPVTSPPTKDGAGGNPAATSGGAAGTSAMVTTQSGGSSGATPSGADGGATSAPPTDSGVPTPPTDAGLSSPPHDAGMNPPPIDAGAGVPPANPGVGWDTVPSILARIVPPTFPNRNCVITDAKYGAVGDGKTDNTGAIAAAIADCASGQGGNVMVPAAPLPAIYFTGPIELQSNVNLNLAAGATVKFSSDPSKYLPVVLSSHEGSLLQNYKPMVSAHDCTNVAITGGGTLDGNATAADWYSWTALETPDSLALRTENARGVPPAQRVFGAGHFLRPSLIEFMHCENLLFDGFTAKNSPFWTIHPVLSKNITGHNVTSLGSVGNTDGFDPESCVDVHLDGLKIMVGDDPIAIKAGRDLDGRTLYTPTENVVIENCTFASNNPTHGASISIGSEMSAGVRNVYAQNITFNDVPGPLAQAIYLKASIYRGGYIQDFYARQLNVASIATFFFINGQYSTSAATLPPNQPVIFTKFSNINVDGATVKSVTSEAFRIDGPDPSQPATNINISNVTVGQGTAIRAGAAHYKNLTFTNVTVAGATLKPAATVP